MLVRPNCEPVEGSRQLIQVIAGGKDLLLHGKIEHGVDGQDLVQSLLFLQGKKDTPPQVLGSSENDSDHIALLQLQQDISEGKIGIVHGFPFFRFPRS
jgi:hypothetical protein